MDAIYKRRSIRKYKNESIPKEKLLEFIKAGMNAPSAMNQQPWHFVIITDKEVLNKITEIHPHSQMLKEASAAILVCGDLVLENGRGYWVQDCSAATENILLEIADQNYGGVWLGVYPREDRINDFKKLFSLPEHIMPLSLVAVGVPNEEKPRKDIFLDERVRYNKWQ